MLFTSPIFIFLFLPVFLLIYYSLPKKLRNFFILAASLIFYSWGEGKLIAIMLISSGIDYIAGIGIANAWRGEIQTLPETGERSKKQKWFLVLSLLGNLSLLGFFKYFNFGIENFNALMHAFGFDAAAWESFGKVALPLGISFYTFQSMSYTIDVYRGRATATRNYITFAAYVTMFPQLVAGPIVRYADVAKELVYRAVTRERFAYGVRRFVVGLAKKVLIANTVAIAADRVFALPVSEIGFGLSWLGVICYALQIYFDFSGYSDMAIGLGHMIGFKFLENFNYPYIAQSLKDFWRRWHMSMSTWFRDYLYISLGGNRKSKGRTYLNLIIVFFITGLWHGASWSFVVWGLWHGLFLIIERLGFGKILARTWRPLRHLYLLLVVLFGWVLFRAETLPYAWSYARAMVGFGAGDNSWETLSLFLSGSLVLALAMGIVGSMRIIPGIKTVCANIVQSVRGGFSVAIRVLFASSELVLLFGLFIISMMQLASDTYNPFIYFRF